MPEKGICPKCGGQMDWKKVDFNPLNFLFFTASPVVHAWKCRQCGNEIGRTDSTTGKVPPPQAIKLPYQCKAYKRFTFRVHDCSLEITAQGVEFKDTQESQYSFRLTSAQIKQAKIEQKLYDMVITLQNGSRYEVGLDKEKYDEVLAAIRILLQQQEAETHSACSEPAGKPPVPLLYSATGKPIAFTSSDDDRSRHTAEDRSLATKQPSRVSLSVDAVPCKGGIATGTATFSDGVTAAWKLDHYGRLSLVVECRSYRPSSEDTKELQEALTVALKERGF